MIFERSDKVFEKLEAMNEVWKVSSNKNNLPKNLWAKKTLGKVCQAECCSS